jgi:hypothetical protein
VNGSLISARYIDRDLVLESKRKRQAHP